MRRPHAWLTLALLALAAAGAFALRQPWAVATDAYTLRTYWAREYWEAAFDALSAACGVGLLQTDLYETYTPAGRWVLTGLGLVGAALFVAAALQSLRPLLPAPGLAKALPRTVGVLVSFLFATLLAIGAAAGLLRWNDPQVDLLEAGRLGGAAFAGLGTLPTPPHAGAVVSASGNEQTSSGAGFATPLVVLGLLGALGWPVWLLTIAPNAQGLAFTRAALRGLLCFVGGVVVLAGLLLVFVQPRGLATPGPARVVSEESSLTLGTVARGAALVAAAGGGGMALAPLGEERSEGAKLVLSLAMLAGGAGGAAGGGLQWLLLGSALASLARGLFGRGDTVEGDALRRAGERALLSMLLLTLTGALGLLAIETLVGSHLQAAPTLADAWLDATALTCGANLTTGVIETVTSRNLTSGMYLPINAYQVGMVWTMLLMLAGRVLPVAILARANDAR